jgi:protein disulfide-isomerase
MRMFRLLIVMSFITVSFLNAVEWQTDYARVRSLSQQENKPILLFFNGSDWVGSSMKLKQEILASPAFSTAMGNQLICMEVDFPKHTKLSESLSNQNEKLKARFKIQEFPSLVLIDPNERVIAQMSYLPENGEQLAADLLKILKQDAELSLGLQQIDDSCSPAYLKKIYLLAQELGNGTAIEKILEIGIKTNDPFFCLEHYRRLVEKGEMKSERALALMAYDPRSELINGQAIPFTVALIDFQELSASMAPETAAQPLIEYLARFSILDQDNIWRIEMMLADVFLEADKWEEALEHAQKAYQAAPSTMHQEIAHSLDYIRTSHPR